MSHALPSSVRTRELLCDAISSSGVKVLIVALACVAAMLVGGCSKDAEAQVGALPPPSVSVAPAVQRNLNDREEFSGRLEAIEFVELRPRVTGTIEKVHFVDGALIRKGDLLFTIDPRPFEAEADRAQAQVAATQARSHLAGLELERATSLLESQAVSKQEVDQLTSATRTSTAEIASAQAALKLARLNQGYTQVRAPISGRTSRAFIRTGNLVNEQSVLTSIAGVARIYAYFDASEQSFLGLKTAPNKTPARIQMRLANETSFAHQGELDFIDNRLNSQTGSIRLRASFDNAKGEFTPGLAVRVRMESPNAYVAVLVPERALGTDQSKKFVYVVGADGKAQYREVMPGPLFDTMRVVRSGVKAGENVVIDGLQRVMPGSPVSAQVLKTDAEGVPLPPKGTSETRPASNAKT